MTVRRATAGDETTLRDLRLQALSDDPDAFGSTLERDGARTTAEWQQWLTSSPTFFLENGTSAQGLVAGQRDQDDPSIVYLMSMWVHPSVRGNGSADALVAELIAWARRTGATTIRLQVITTNHRARRFYERHGFRATGQEVVRARDGRMEMQMQRSLADRIDISQRSQGCL